MKLNLNKLIQEIINEGVSQIVYHRTGFEALLNILKENKIIFSTNIVTGADKTSNKQYFLSLSRTKSPKMGYSKQSNVIIEFDGSRLNQRFKGGAVDYWQWDNLSPNQRADSDEFEDRIYSDEPYLINLDKYITNIYIVFFKHSDDYLNYIFKRMRGIQNTNSPLIDKIKIYNNERDFLFNKNNISVGDWINQNADKLKDEEEIEYKFDNEYVKKNLLLFYLRIMFLNSQKNKDELKENVINFLNNLKISYDVGKIGDADINKVVHNIINNSKYLSSDNGLIKSIEADIHNITKSQHKNTETIEIIHLLGKEMKRYGVTNFTNLIKAKEGQIFGKTKKDYTKKYAIGFESYDRYILIDNKKSNWLDFNILPVQDQRELFDIEYPVSIKTIINFVFNKYNEKTARDYINKMISKRDSDNIFLIDLDRVITYEEIYEKDYENNDIGDRGAWWYIESDDWFNLLKHNLSDKVFNNNLSRITKIINNEEIKLRFIYGITKKILGEKITKDFFNKNNLTFNTDEHEKYEYVLKKKRGK